MGDTPLSQAVTMKSLMTKAMRREQYEVVLFLVGALSLLAHQSNEVTEMVHLEEEELNAMVLQATGHDMAYYANVIYEYQVTGLSRE
jgi:hypothetical protein